MSSELIEQDSNVVALHTPFDIDPKQFKAALDRREENRKQMLLWIKDSLVEGVDYGIIKGKKSLWKPGAEKVRGMLGVKVTYPDANKYIEACASGVDIQQVIIKTVVTNTNGIELAQGIGGRTLRQDGGDINKAVKMASKSASIDATLNVAGLSEIFTLDLEDMFPDEIETPKKTKAPSKPPEKKTKKKVEKPAVTDTESKNEKDNIPFQFDPTPEDKLKTYIEGLEDPAMVVEAKRIADEVKDLDTLKKLWMTFKDARDQENIDEESFKIITDIKDLMKEIIK